MSFCGGKQRRKMNLRNLPMNARYIQTKSQGVWPQNNSGEYQRNQRKKTSLSIRGQGSYTLEAAVVLPLVAGFFVAILFFFRVLQVQTQVQESLDYASRKTACEASLVSSESGLSGSAEVFFRKELNSYTLPASCIKGGTAGISLRSSSSSDVYVTLQAVYRVKLPIPFFHLQGIAVTQNSKSHKWTGDRGDLAEDTYVYVTENGTVYHRSRDCSYLDLSIQSVQAADLAGLRNKNAHKYNACKDCVAKNAASGVVYITDYGTCYHIRVSCSGLKRTIYLIPLSEVGTKGACSKCGGTKSKN